jgi:hypothetical protein
MAAVVAVIIGVNGVPPPTPNPPGTFAFAAFGDAPYDPLESARYPFALADIDAHDLAFSIHIGDMFWRPCSEEMYSRSLRWFNALKRPLIYVPGDNEWADCWTQQEGGYNPRDRLAVLRRIMYPKPGVSLGAATLPLETQSSESGYEEFVEHARWTHDRVVFATIHVVGSGNFTQTFPGRQPADDEEVKRRVAASLAWLRETFARAKDARAVVIAFHADPDFEGGQDQIRYAPMLDALAVEAIGFGKPVLLIHGDSHHFITDTPLRSRGDGRVITNVTRLEVPGSPDVGWTRVVVTPGDSATFAFEARVVPSWKVW